MFAAAPLVVKNELGMAWHGTVKSYQRYTGSVTSVTGRV